MIDGGKNKLFVLGAVAIVGIAVAVGWAVGTSRRPAPQAQKSVVNAGRRGEVLFQANCANCHGPDGRGNGMAAITMRPPPRDFSARPWRFDVSKESIARVIRDGIPGTPMPAGRAAISEGDIVLLADHVYTLATSRPTVPFTPPAEERLLSAAGFVSLQGVAAPPLILENSTGGALRLADLKGKLVLLHFWGTGCEHCLEEMPALKKLESEWSARGLRVVHICTDTDDAKEAQALLEGVTPGLTAWVESNGIGLARFDVKVLPSVWIVDAQGKAVARGQGGRDWTSPDVLKCLDSLLPK